MDAIEYPICHLDFETIMPGVPMFYESRPYQQIPFQYSIHLQDDKAGPVRHCEYLAPSDPGTDPRPGLIEQLIDDTKNARTIFVYSIAFERTCVNEIMRDFPGYKEQLQSINDRMHDLIIPFRRKYYRTGTMQGSSSLKMVLPALCPELSYQQMEIGDGQAASNAFLDLYYCKDEEYKIRTRQHLLNYCNLDTLAMAKILEALKGV